MTEDQIRELFREMREDPVPPDSQARVRLAVAEGVLSWKARLRRRWMLAAAVLVPACVVLIATLTREPARVVVQPPPVQQTASVPETPVPDAPVTHAARAPRRVVRHKQSQPAAMVVRIETPDPNIVIILVGS